MLFDIIIVGSGLFGATFARLALDRNLKVLVLEQRKEIGGNIRTENKDGIEIHKYGAHIFHTSNEEVWNFVNKYISFNNYKHYVMAKTKNNKIYSLPFSLKTFNEFYNDVITPLDLNKKIKEVQYNTNIKDPHNLEEQAIKIIGFDIYNTLIKDYTYKQWNINPKELSKEIIKRLPIRDTYDISYFNDKYQGIPEDGSYTKLIEKLLDGAVIKTNTNFIDNLSFWAKQSYLILYTGCIDELCHYSLGTLGWRTCKFETIKENISNYQGCPVMNYVSDNVKYTRIIEHKHFDIWNTHNEEYTYITKEYPIEWKKGLNALYPINNNYNQKLYNDYKKLISEIYPFIVLGGRLGDYKYYDMDDTIYNAIKLFNKIYIN